MGRIITRSYCIICDSNEQLLERMEILFSKGMVFTTSRADSMKFVKQHYREECMTWKVIYVLHRDCLRVFNTDDAFYENAYSFETLKITWESFLTEKLPKIISFKSIA